MPAKKKRTKKEDCASPLMRRNLDALGKALGAAMAEDLKEAQAKSDMWTRCEEEPSESNSDWGW